MPSLSFQCRFPAVKASFPYSVSLSLVSCLYSYFLLSLALYLHNCIAKTIQLCYSENRYSSMFLNPERSFKDATKKIHNHKSTRNYFSTYSNADHTNRTSFKHSTCNKRSSELDTMNIDEYMLLTVKNNMLLKDSIIDIATIMGHTPTHPISSHIFCL